ncbi:MAG: sigma-70 family RNA polymerase sigma factor [Chloroflexota bacterium]
MDKERDLATLREALERLAADGEQERVNQRLVNQVWPVLQINFDRGRITRWQQVTNKPLDDYVRIVLANFQENQHYLHQLQRARDEAVWAELFTQLKSWAYRYLIQKNFQRNQETYDLAQSYATETAIVLLDSHFPFDLDFTPWAVTLLHHTCNRLMRRAVAKKRNPDGGTVSLADSNEFLQNLAATDVAQQQEVRQNLLDAIERLPNPKWREVLLLRYVDGLEPSEIASQLNKTPSAVYSLHFRAIAELKKMLVVT